MPRHPDRLLERLAPRPAAAPIKAGAVRSPNCPFDLVTLDEPDVLGMRSRPNACPAMIALLASGVIRDLRRGGPDAARRCRPGSGATGPPVEAGRGRPA